jgi:hypothetical protein
VGFRHRRVGLLDHAEAGTLVARRAFEAFALEHDARSLRVLGLPSWRGEAGKAVQKGQANTLRRKLRRPSVKKTTLKATMAG